MSNAKPKFTTPDLTQSNIDKLSTLFPSAITEAVDEEKSTPENKVYKKAVNFEALKTLLGDDDLSGNEAYEFTWVGKKASILEANKPIRKTFRPCKEDSRDWDTTQNLYIEGDNLEVLKLLQESYLGKIKMIYIDPPYNTGNDFVYRDDFRMNKDDYDKEAGLFDEEENRLFRNPESNGRFHSDWCSMIYPRLLLARNLLRDDGVIFISIDDGEVAQLRKICDAIFGEENFLATITRRTKSGGGSAAHHFAVEHDFMIVFCKNLYALPPLSVPFDEQYAKRYSESDKNGRYFWDTMARSSTATKPYVITAPDGSKLKGKWFRSEERFLDDLKMGEVKFLKKKDGSWSVQFKQRMAEGQKIRTIFAENEFKSGQSDLIQLGMENYFDYPKTIYLLMHFVRSIKGNSDIILDFFSGSATTAHAVMQLNAEDSGNRKFIMVQLPEPCEKDSEAAKAGYKNICEIGKERIRRAGNKILEEWKEKEKSSKEGLTEGDLFDKLIQETPNSKLQTPNSKLQTPNSKLQTPNSKLQTPNSKRHLGHWFPCFQGGQQQYERCVLRCRGIQAGAA
jgi:adenine-specific DNA-methyltransferase